MDTNNNSITVDQVDKALLLKSVNFLFTFRDVIEASQEIDYGYLQDKFYKKVKIAVLDSTGKFLKWHSIILENTVRIDG